MGKTMYVLYATTNNDNGYVTKLGEYEDPTDIRINIGTFSSDVVISIELEQIEE